MKKCLTLLLLITLCILFAQPKPPYPIIFVHGLSDSDECFEVPMRYLNNTFDEESSGYNWGNINSFDIVLNFDDDNKTSLLDEDVRWEDCYFDEKLILLGRRNYERTSNKWDSKSSIYAVNFQEERITGASGILNDLFDHSNESAIYKQGFALGKMIKEVLEYTGAQIKLFL